MKLKIVIDMNNDAFQDTGGSEVCRILGKVMNDLRYVSRQSLVGYERKLLDFNGNNVGKVKVVK